MHVSCSLAASEAGCFGYLEMIHSRLVWAACIKCGYKLDIRVFSLGDWDLYAMFILGSVLKDLCKWFSS